MNTPSHQQISPLRLGRIQTIGWFLGPLCLLLAIGFSQNVQSQLEPTAPYWHETEQWTPCSEHCGPGTQRKLFKCVTRDLYSILTVVEDEKCGSLPASTQRVRNCNMGTCNGYHWRVSEWAHCSQTCGAFGTMSRDVDCVYDGPDGHIVVQDSEAAYHCGRYGKPETHGPCHRVACKPEFVPEQWGKCIQGDPCRAGRQIRQLSCISTQRNGTHRNLPKAACYLHGQPLHRTWRRCFIASTSRCESKQPTIDTDRMTIVQMRRARSLNLQVGQRAFVIPYTRLVVRCPVHYFSVHDIEWHRPNEEILRYTGSTSERVSVDKQGRLRVRSFRIHDSGEWQCNAGNQHAKISFIPRTPAEGFHDWVQRNRLWTKGMMSDDPKDMAAVHAIVQWVEGPWSSCSISCGETGQQFRTVRCERVDTRFYQILNDQACLDKLLPKPISRRECLKSTRCPTWGIEGADHAVCTNRCIGVNKGTTQGNLTCRIGSRQVEEKLCESSEKPDLSCQNPLCRVEWKIGPWSQCSRLCGGVGVRARQLLCTWMHDKRPAGSVCYATKLPTPQVIEECEAPPCKFDCVDFSQYCPKRVELCKFTLYRYQCCASCRKHVLASRTSPLEEAFPARSDYRQ